MTDPEAEAERLLDDLRIRGPEDLAELENVAWACGALVSYSQLDGAEARLAALDGNAIITISTAVRSPERRRFSIGHELGHLRMHRQDSSVFICTADDISESGPGEMGGWEKRERQANQFAAAFLMPRRFFAGACRPVKQPNVRRAGPSRGLIESLAERFGTSLTSTALRYLDFSGEPCAVVRTVDRRISWFVPNKDFRALGLVVARGRDVAPYSNAAEFFRVRTVGAESERVDVACWCSPGPFRLDAQLTEISWGSARDNSVLTLLWIDEDIDPEDDD